MKPHLILVHGMWSQANVWDNWLPALHAAGYGTTALNLPGHEPGRPDSALKGLGLGEYADAVLAEMRKHEKPVLIGHSMGGLISQLAAARGDAGALVLISSAVPSPLFPLRPKTMIGTLRAFSNPLLYRSTLRLLRWEANYLLFNRLDAADKPACYQLLIAESGRAAYQVAFGPLNLAGSNRVDKAAVTCPVLSLAGADDRIVPAAAGRAMADWYGGAPRIEHREYAEHAHMMMFEPGGDARVQEIIGWLDAR